MSKQSARLKKKLNREGAWNRQADPFLASLAQFVAEANQLTLQRRVDAALMPSKLPLQISADPKALKAPDSLSDDPGVSV